MKHGLRFPATQISGCQGTDKILTFYCSDVKLKINSSEEKKLTIISIMLKHLRIKTEIQDRKKRFVGAGSAKLVSQSYEKYL